MSRVPKDVVRALVQAYNAKSLGAVLGHYASDAFFWDPLHRDGVRGRDAIGSVIEGLFAAFPDEHMAIESLIGDESHAVAEILSRGSDAAGACFEVHFTEVYEIRKERVVSCRVYIDPQQLPGAGSHESRISNED
jgi:ketosteroid isomerase-like protein